LGEIQSEVPRQPATPEEKQGRRSLLASGVDRHEARALVRDELERVIAAWKPEQPADGGSSS
jgi:hypothetical protein